MKRLLLFFTVCIKFFTFGQDYNFDWTISEGGISSDFSFCVTSDSYGNVYTIGMFNDTVDFDPGIGVFELASNGLTDIYVQKLDPQGNLIWVKQMGGAFADYGYSIVTDDLGNVYTTGNFHDSVDFDPGSGSDILVANGDITEEDIFVQKLDVNGNLVWVTYTKDTNNFLQSFLLKTSKLQMDKDNLYFSNNQNSLFSVDKNSGFVNWRQNINSEIKPLIVENLIFSLAAIIHLKLNWMRSVFKVMNFLHL